QGYGPRVLHQHSCSATQFEVPTCTTYASGIMTAPHPAHMGEHRPTRMISHWEPPGSYPGRPFYSWYFTFEDAGQLHDLVERYSVALRPLQVDIVPPEGLHLTLQNVGYTDEVDTATIHQLGDAAAASCAQVPPFEVEIDRAVVHPEAVLLLV